MNVSPFEHIDELHLLPNTKALYEQVQALFHERLTSKIHNDEQAELIMKIILFDIEHEWLMDSSKILAISNEYPLAFIARKPEEDSGVLFTNAIRNIKDWLDYVLWAWWYERTEEDA